MTPQMMQVPAQSSYSHQQVSFKLLLNQFPNEISFLREFNCFQQTAWVRVRRAEPGIQSILPAI
jgi:hypothetical protein